MNQTYRLVWSHLTHSFIPAAEHARGRGKQGRALRALVAAVALGNAPLLIAADLPNGGRVVAGQGSIAQSGNTMTITQGSQRMVTDWQGFSIGQGHTVQFVQPSSNAAALNRVTGSDPSVIQGALRANGQVFLVNPNGVLFTPSAQVNVGGLVASTLNVSNDDFMAGRYRFAGDSTNPVINQGNIVAANGGTVAMIAARIVNTGSISAPEGNVLMGAGSRVTLDLGGPVKIEVAQGALDALIEQGGAIRADGGLVYLTARAANALTTTVINHTGVTEAKTLASGKEGRIFLMGDMDNDRIVIGGRFDASAPAGGNGGFVETSAAQVKVNSDARVTTLAARGQHGTWLIDPEDFTIGAGTGAQSATGIGADTLGANLASSNVALATVSSGTGNGDIHVNAAVSWSADTTLTLSAHRNININADITATGANGKLALEYGQVGGAVNNTSDYYLANGVKVHLQAGQNFSTKLGSDGITVNYQVITALGAENSGSVNNDVLQGVNLARNLAYALGADIDATPTTSWNSGDGFTPLGSTATPFTGVFTGLGHVVGGLRIDRGTGSQVGMFGVVSGNGTTVRDVHVGAQGASTSAIVGANEVGGLVATLENGAKILGSSFEGTVTGRFDVGGLVGKVVDSGSRVTRSRSAGTVAVSLQDSDNQTGGLVGFNEGGISLSSSSASVNSAGKVGGLVGRNFGSISDSSASGAVTGVDALAGGLVGHNARLTSLPFTTGSIERSHATGTVSVNAGDVGGLVGMNSGTVNTAYATGAVTIGGEGYGGGLVGRNDGASSVISVTYATGPVTTTGSGGLVGGLAGSNDGQIATSFATGTVTGGGNGTSAAGLVGVNAAGATISNTYATGAVVNQGEAGSAGLVFANEGTIINSYSTGPVSTALATGGLIAVNGGTVTSSYWDVERSGQATSDGGTPKTTAEMKQLSTFTAGNWIITDQGRTGAIWRIYEGYTTPWLIPHFAANVDVQPIVTSKIVDGNAVMQGSFTLNDFGVIELTSVNPAVAQLNNAYVRGTHVYTAASPVVGTHAVTMTGLWSNQLEYNLHVLPATGTILPVGSVPPAPESGQPPPAPEVPAYPGPSPVAPPPNDARADGANSTTTQAARNDSPVPSGTGAPFGGAPGGTNVNEMAINTLQLVNVEIVMAPTTQNGAPAVIDSPADASAPASSGFADTTFVAPGGSSGDAATIVQSDVLPANAGAQSMVQGNPVGIVRVFSINGGVRVE